MPACSKIPQVSVKSIIAQEYEKSYDYTMNSFFSDLRLRYQGWPHRKRARRYALLAAFLLLAWAALSPRPAPPLPDAPIMRPAGPQAASLGALIASMAAPERDYHRMSFDYAMDRTPPGARHAWQSYASSGRIEPGPVKESGATRCRTYREVISSGKYKEIYGDGVACKRVGDAGWCRLRAEDMQSCALEPPRGLIDQAIQAGQDTLREGMWEVKRGVTHGENAVERLWQRWSPF